VLTDYASTRTSGWYFLHSQQPRKTSLILSEEEPGAVGLPQNSQPVLIDWGLRAVGKETSLVAIRQTGSLQPQITAPCRRQLEQPSFVERSDEALRDARLLRRRVLAIPGEHTHARACRQPNFIPKGVVRNPGWCRHVHTRETSTDIGPAVETYATGG
jgi:hypothetical protein